MFRQLILLVLGLCPSFLAAAPVAYDLVADSSEIAFVYRLQGQPVRGSFPDFSTDISLDIAQPEKSDIRVTIDTRSLKAGFILATSTMRGPDMLDVKNHPTISFRSTDLTVAQDLSDAVLEGVLTIKSTSRPVRLAARVSRPAGNNPDQLDALTVSFSGQISRSDFGFTSFPDLVEDQLLIFVKAWVTKRK